MMIDRWDDDRWDDDRWDDGIGYRWVIDGMISRPATSFGIIFYNFRSSSRSVLGCLGREPIALESTP